MSNVRPYLGVQATYAYLPLFQIHLASIGEKERANNYSFHSVLLSIVDFNIAPKIKMVCRSESCLGADAFVKWNFYIIIRYVVGCRFLLHVTGLVALEVVYRSIVAHVERADWDRKGLTPSMHSCCSDVLEGPLAP